MKCVPMLRLLEHGFCKFCALLPEPHGSSLFSLVFPVELALCNALIGKENVLLRHIHIKMSAHHSLSDICAGVDYRPECMCHLYVQMDVRPGMLSKHRRLVQSHALLYLQVLTRGHNGRVTFEPVYVFGHQDSDAAATFVQLHIQVSLTRTVFRLFCDTFPFS